MGTIKLKRIYEAAAYDDGIRILVDRLWPRGMSKEMAKVDDWLRELGPSTELRKWFNHDVDKYEGFKKKYKAELSKGTQYEALEQLREMVENAECNITLLYAAKDTKYNNAQVLKEILE